MNLRNLIDAAFDLFFGAICPGCTNPGIGLCPVCRKYMRQRRTHSVKRPIADFPATQTTHLYQEETARCLIAYKERGRWWLARELVEPLRAGIHRLAESEPITLVPIPSAAANILARGEDVTKRLAQRLSRNNPNIEVRVLLRRNPVPDQSSLSNTERHANMRNGMTVKPDRSVNKRRIILVDDIVTTGATLAAASRVLTATGYQVIGAVTVAETPKYH